VNHRRHDGHHEDHHARQGVEPQRPFDIDSAGGDPGRQVHHPRPVVAEDLAEQQDAEHHRGEERAAGDELGAAVADRPAKESGDRGSNERQEDDEDGEGGHSVQPRIIWMSSTWIVPRLRK
jgi:hypothetical protein